MTKAKSEFEKTVATAIDLKNRMTLEEPGKVHIFDVRNEFVQEVGQQHSLQALMAQTKGKKSEALKEAFSHYGRSLMNTVIELANGKYRDRTADMVERIARQTGIWFPDLFRRYVEIALLTSRPEARWNVELATRKELRLSIRNCPILNTLRESGLKLEGLPCRNVDLGSFEVALEKLGKRLQIEMTKAIVGSGLQECQFNFFL